ncbi:RdgB/HAM1 family non-canonical purine NTP pyrophosphatase [Ectothiorhodospira lacustris]|uniref:RdgB/HAM1 family non-canonical purine NTP pyrophosphatase n=1 Tax=Ectothiorhodospira lacustris TaxID=2899127 RepID=UPI001EE8C92C|nr:RdgB/HAM1 family non-canonical purine NTP pyrophosphatase [Ectothiorhodospira lacustris]MCG5501122.1 RdgB/HAM1 family non-canonical purine NTP pyrophosphatase [Ectothiorhodospira lacustris]MCG5510822.1 RdgB/HAM1 family non-canonical purine NTP pyrophosphatase [Ectothiorhodospira lacustris]MCG5522632.1 RdgB/HAM1 family non-canonical purine NTP pyrophosphatase [Ectothiorhodospira lacustris]
MKIVLATGNAGKVREFADLLAGSGHEVLPQSDFQVREAEETGLSFVENAILKARNAAEQTGLPAMADDSGIEVDALDGAPGIYSARYAGPGAAAGQNNSKLLEALKGVPEGRRTARFRCIIAFLRHARDPSPILCEGTWEGAVALRPAGDGGHGYDPVFLVPELGLTAAQISAEEKNRRSHRGQALTSLLTRLGGPR